MKTTVSTKEWSSIAVDLSNNKLGKSPDSISRTIPVSLSEHYWTILRLSHDYHGIHNGDFSVIMGTNPHYPVTHVPLPGHSVITSVTFEGQAQR
jgi:hypothetical protein